MLNTYEVEISKDVDITNEELIDLHERMGNPTTIEQDKVKKRIKDVIFYKTLYDAIERVAHDDDVVHSELIYNRVFRIFLDNRTPTNLIPTYDFIYFIYNNPQVIEEEVRRFLNRRRLRGNTL